MEYVRLGNSDIQVSRFCLGCMSFGDPASKMHAWTLNADESEKIIRHALDLGINFFDTANGYSAGTSEEYLGRCARPDWETDTLRSRTDAVARGKYDGTEAQNKGIAARIGELARKYGATMSQIAFAWHFAKGVASPVIGATKEKYLDETAGALEIRLSEQDVAYIDELYVPHKIVGAL